MAGIAAVFTAFPPSVTLPSVAAKEKSSSRPAAWLAPILFLLAAVAAAPSAPASMTRALETRAWEKTSAPLESRPVESLQLLNLHQQNGVAGYDDALGSPLAAEGGAAAGDTVTVYRVQGGVMPNASKTLITLDGAGNPIIQDGTLNVSIGDGGAHSQYFQALRPGSTVTSFEIPSWMHDLIQENAIPQDFYTSNPLNQGGLAPKITDINTPGLSYELPSPWGQWLQENAIPGSGKVK